MTQKSATGRRGRPRSANRTYDFREVALYKLLLDALPQYTKTVDAQGVVTKSLDIPTLASDLGYQRQSIYRWFDDIRMSKRAAKALIEKSDGRLTNEDLLPFFL